MSIIINDSSGKQNAIYDSEEYEYVEGQKGIDYSSKLIVNNINVHTVKVNGITIKRDYCFVSNKLRNWGFSQVDHLIALYYYNTPDGKLHVDAELYSGDAALNKATEYNIRNYCAGHVLGYNIKCRSATNTTAIIKGSSKTNTLTNTSIQNVGLTLGTASVEKTFMWEEQTDTIDVSLQTIQCVVDGGNIYSESFSNLNYNIKITAPEISDTSTHTYYIVKTSNVTLTLNWGASGGGTIKFLDELI